MHCCEACNLTNAYSTYSYHNALHKYLLHNANRPASDMKTLSEHDNNYYHY